MSVITGKMPKKKQEENGSIPKYILNNLVEFTPGGFLLFHFNSETGFPEHLMTFDSPACYLAMTNYVNNWSKAIEKVHLAVASNDIGQNIINTEE